MVLSTSSQPRGLLEVSTTVMKLESRTVSPVGLKEFPEVINQLIAIGHGDIRP